jgi:hypothetical protein
MLGDTEQTLRPLCHESLESEANFGSGRLLFLRDRFVKESRDVPAEIASVRALAATFNNTLTSTLWRYVESVHPGRLVMGAITCHPHRRKRPADFNPNDPCRYFIRSPAFALKFSSVTEVEVFEAIASYCGAQRGGPLGAAEFPIVDDNGDRHPFVFETFFNGHDALTIAVRK